MGLREEDSRFLSESCLKIHDALFELWKRHKAGKLSRKALRKALEPRRPDLKILLEVGTEVVNDTTAWTCRQLLKAEAALWRFAEVKGAEPTNDAAERALRRAVILRKKSFGSQSRRGSVFLERLWSVVETCRRQGLSALDFVAEACRCLWAGQPPPALVTV